MPIRVPRDGIAATLHQLLRPVVRRLLAWGVTYPVFDEVARGVFVEVADREMSLPHKRQTDSRVALLTGIHRKEAARLRALPPGCAPRRLERTPIARLLGRWLAGPPFADRRCRPRALPYESARPGGASFARLVREAGIDGPARAVLDELVHGGTARMTDGGAVELVREVLVPTEGLAGKLELLGSDPGEVFGTIAHNIEVPGDPWLHRKVVYDNLGADALPTLRARARQAGDLFVREANALLAAHDRDRNPAAPGGRRTRVVVATYYFEEPVEPDEADPAPAAARLPGRITRPARSLARSGR